jgi:hypothetical protein
MLLYNLHEYRKRVTLWLMSRLISLLVAVLAGCAGVETEN